MNWASTKTDTSHWPTKWTRRSPNWQDIRLLYLAIFCPIILSENQNSVFLRIQLDVDSFDKKERSYALDMTHIHFTSFVINTVIVMKLST